MTYEGYLNDQRNMRKSHDQELLRLAKRYAESKNTVKIGDIVRDHMGKVRVEKISFSLPLSSEPQSVYIGLEVKLDGTPKKRDIKREVYSSNLRRGIKV